MSASMLSFLMLTALGPAAEPERPATLLLVTSEELAPAWQDFADWKTRLGKSTKIVTLAALDQQYLGADIQQKIRACVLEHIDKHGTRWVLLGGDCLPGGKGQVPARVTPHPGMGYDDIPTDLYFLSPKSWDANNDGRYGDWQTDRAAIAYTHGQASIGRAPLRTRDDVRAYTAKVMAYESRYPAGAFAQRLVYTCPIPHAYPKLNTSRDTIAALWKEGTILQFFADKTPWDQAKPGDFPLSPSNWSKLIDRRDAGKLHMHGHGFLNVWVLEGDKPIDLQAVAKLANRDAYPIITTVSCFTGQFDAAQDPSIAEAMLRKPQGGAIALLAPSREGVPIFADRNDLKKMITEGKMDGTTQTMTRFWALGLSKDLTLGEAFAAAKAAMAEDAQKHPGYHWCQCELNLLGDPSLPMRARAPTTPKLVLPKSLPLGKQLVKIETAAPGATVCFWLRGQDYVVVQADKQGLASATITARSAGKLLVAVSGPNLNAALAEVLVQ